MVTQAQSAAMINARRRRRSLAKGAGVIDPLTLFTKATNGAWFDFTDRSTLFQDSARATPVTASGQSVRGVADKSGFARHAAQTVAAQAPLYKADDLGMAYLDGTDDNLRADALATLMAGDDAAVTFHFVMNPRLRTSDAGQVMGFGNTGNATPYMQAGRNSQANVQVFKRSDANVLVSANAGVLVKYYSRRSVVTLRFNGTTLDSWVNGTRILTAAPFDTGTLTLNAFTIGALVRNTVSAWFSGAIQEFMAFAGSQSDADVADLQSYLQEKHRPKLSAVDVFWILGQSNAEGRGNAYAETPISDGIAYQWEIGALSPLQHPVGDAATGSAWVAFAAQWYASTGRIAVFIECATGGTAMIPAAGVAVSVASWSPTAGALYAPAKAALDGLLSYLSSKGITVANKYALWLQGETEGDLINGTTISGAAYQTEFTALCNRIKSDYPGMVTLISELGAPDNGLNEAGFAEIRAAQAAVAASVPGVVMAYTGAKSFPAASKMADRLHYLQSGYNDVGTGMALGGSTF